MRSPAGFTTPTAGAQQALTVRALAAGLAVGTVLCFSNMYFGLQTGWVTMGSLQSAILGYGLFQGLSASKLITRHLSVAENVIVQTTAVATATMPLAAGLVGIIPALGLLSPEDNPPTGPIKLTPLQLLGWCAALAFFGVFVAVPLRYQTIIREKLRFPSGTATASVIRTLHGLPQPISASATQVTPAATAAAPATDSFHLAQADASHGCPAQAAYSTQQAASGTLPHSCDSVCSTYKVDTEQLALLSDGAIQSLHSMPSTHNTASAVQPQHDRREQLRQQQWGRALRLLLWCFAVSGTYSIAAAWVQPLRVLPVFDWLGLPAATAWGWVLQPSMGYIGQGMIMGPKTAWSMMAGALTGWAILGPAARAKGWAPGPIKSIETGAAGWLMWLGLALLLGDCFSELGVLMLQTGWQHAKKRGWLDQLNKMLPFLRLNVQEGRPKRNGGGYKHLIDDRDAEQGLVSGHINAGTLEMSPSGSMSGLEVVVTDLANGTSAVADGIAPGSSTVSVGIPGCQHGGHLQQDGRQHCRQCSRLSTQPGGSGTGDVDSSSNNDSSNWMLSPRFWVPGLLLSTLLATTILSPLLGMPVQEPLIAVLVALLVALLAVRALGQTDLNPVSGVGKISQLVFAVVSPGAVVPNLVAGAIAEAGAQQAGDLMQDFKTAHLLGVPPSSQLVAMLLGSAASVPLSVGAYLLYTNAWEVPGPILPAPTAQIWLDMAKLVNGGQLPDHVAPFCAGAAAIAAALPILQHVLHRLKQQQHAAVADTGQLGQLQPSIEYADTPGKDSDAGAEPNWSSSAASSDLPQRQWQSQQRKASILGKPGVAMHSATQRVWYSLRLKTVADWSLALLPSGVGFAVGMYLTPNWTVPRLIGSIAEQLWLLLNPASHAAYMMVTASGLVLGEGCASVVTAVVHAIMA